MKSPCALSPLPLDSVMAVRYARGGPYISGSSRRRWL
jgi:hypothetical protein